MLGRKKTRFAVVGAGWFGQAAILPAFAKTKYAELKAIVSGDSEKARELGDRYSVPIKGYDEFDALCEGGEIDAVFIALPNSKHREYTERAAKRKIHVLCEKPLAANAAECRAMIAVCENNEVYLMTAYRLHFEPANLAAIDLIHDGAIGDTRLFHGINCQRIDNDENSRLDGSLKGGPLMDLGVYCINAARYCFRAEPTVVFGYQASLPGEKFAEVPEMVSAVLRFPGDRLAMFACGFGESKVSEYRVIGTAGDIRLSPAFSFQSGIDLEQTVGGKTKTENYPECDQVAGEIDYFSQCIQKGETPEPDGREGSIDLAIIDAIKESIHSGLSVSVGPFEEKPRPDGSQKKRYRPTRSPELINAESPAGD